MAVSLTTACGGGDDSNANLVDAAPGAGDATLDVGSASPDAGDASLGAGDASPDTGNASPDAGDASPDAGDASPDAGDASPDAGDASPDAGDASLDAGAVAYVPGVTVSTLAGSDDAGAQNGTGGAAQFDNPTGIAIDKSGNLVVTEYDGSRVRYVTPAGAVTTIGDTTGFTGPFAAVVASDGTYYIETDFNSAGVKNATSGTIWRLVPLADGGVAAPTVVSQGYGRPRGLAPIDGGDLFVADRYYSIVDHVAMDGGVATFLAGQFGDAGYAEGAGAAAKFSSPIGVATLPDGDFLVADEGNNRIRRVTPAGVVTTFAGDGNAGWVDGALAGAEFNAPRAVAVDAAGDVFVSDNGNHCIRRITAAGVVATLAGDGTLGFRDGAGAQAELYGQEGIAVTADGKTLYFTDGNSGDGTAHHRVRMMTIP